MESAKFHCTMHKTTIKPDLHGEIQELGCNYFHLKPLKVYDVGLIRIQKGLCSEFKKIHHKPWGIMKGEKIL